MVVSTGISFSLASISAVLIFSGMQMYKPWLASTQMHTIFGGYLGSIFFILSLTAMGNLEAYVFGKSYQIKLFPEVTSCLLLSLFVAGSIHRVCATICLLISMCALYYVNKYSQRIYSVQSSTSVPQTGKKKKN